MVYSLTMNAREKYLKIVKIEGLDKAISTLHNYLNTVETHVFDGGFSQDRFEELQTLRELSRELWDLRLVETSKRTRGTS